MGWRKSKSQIKPETAAKNKKRSAFRYLGEALSGFVICLLAFACIITVAILWGWSQRDQFLSAEIRKQLQQKFPEWNIQFESAEFDQRGRVILKSVLIDPHQNDAPICEIEGMRITVDRELLIEQKRLDIQLVELNRPTVRAIRHADGHWNWSNLPAPEKKEDPLLPLIKIRDAVVIFQWEQAEFARAMRMRVEAIDADFTPSARHSYEFSGTGKEAQLGRSEFAGTFDLEHKTWNISGELENLRIDQPFLQTVADFSPDAERIVAQLQQSGRFTPSPNGSGIQTAEHTDSHDPNETMLDALPVSNSQRDINTQFSLELTSNISFRTTKELASEPDYMVSATLTSGLLEHPDLPVPLDRIEGRIAIDRRGLRINEMSLASGATSARVNGAWGWNEGSLPAGFQDGFFVDVQNYRVTPVTRGFLPGSLRKIYDELTPAGVVTVGLKVYRNASGKITSDLNQAVVSEGSILHEMFRYPVQQVQGNITRADDGSGPETWNLNFTGLASGQMVEVNGKVIDPGPDAEVTLNIVADHFPIDEQFYRALDDKQRTAVRYMGLQGQANVQCFVSKNGVEDDKPNIQLEIDLYDSTMLIKSFPYAVRDVSGQLHFDEAGWRMERLRGVHNKTAVTGKGSFLQIGTDWLLDLSLSAKNAAFDQELYLAIQKASPEKSRIWNMLNPRGEFDADIDLQWTEGQPEVTLAIPRMTLRNCEMQPSVFPWRMTDLSAVATMEDNIVTFQNLKARHDHCRVEAAGMFKPHDGYWQLRFDQLVLDDLFPDHEFIAAIPEEARTVVESLKLKAPVSVSGELEFKGDYKGETVTSAWDAKAIFNQADLFLGVDVTKASGSLSFQGQRDRNGVVTIPQGKASIDSCWVMGYHVTNVKGPFVITKDQIIAGSPKMFAASDSAEQFTTVSREERFTGNIFGGELFLDMQAERTPAMPYLLRCTLSRASLEKWAIDSNYGQANIRGEMNGYIDLAGDAVSARQTVGSGRLLIRPAALYELPVMFQMFQSLSLASADATAFRAAYADFRVLDERFVFDEIGLLGDSMSLLGEGSIRFDRTIDLDFVYRPPKRRGINVVSQVLNSFDNVVPILFTVEVDGTLDVPRVKVKNGVRETLRGFRKMLEMAPSKLTPPGILPPQQFRVEPRNQQTASPNPLGF